ncbi:diguanylate cyclase domain-containing protein [Sporosarcina siberiensis]|uniref:Diguanylate cyclase domain-containing protein n=1 Tax=Sporosarcina siberiensis TaxID=1365606 RepID=A0ABW4SHH9_9BACL
MVYYSLTEYLISIIVASLCAFIAITFIKKMKVVEQAKIKIHVISFIFGALIFIVHLNSDVEGVFVDVNFLLGIGLFLYSTFAVNTAINTICLRDVSILKLIFSSIIFALCISLINIVDIWSDMVEEELKMSLYLFISANLLLIGNTISAIRFIRQIRNITMIRIQWIIVGSIAIGIAFASIRYALYSSITMFSDVDLFGEQFIIITEWVYLHNGLLPIMVNIFALILLELVPGFFSEIYSKEQKEAINENRQRYATLFNNQAIAIYSLNPKGLIEKINYAVEKMTGVKPESIKGNSSFIDFIHISDQEEFSFHLSEALGGNSRMLETKIKTLSNTYINVQITLVPIYRKEELTNIHVYTIDITEIVETREKMQHMAYHDSLTKLPNRTYFSKELNRRLEIEEEPMAICLMDLDRFKVINDVLGHHMGDELLKALSKRLDSFVKDRDFVARMGGDEFTFLFYNVTSNQEFERKIAKLLDLVQKPFLVEGNELHVTASLGIAMFPDDSQRPDELIKYADIAMYNAKGTGENIYQFYSNQLFEENDKHLMFKEDVQVAIKGKGGV